MNSLLYKTKGHTSPVGKPRVLLICEPEDFPTYSHSIFKDILSIVNCAVYYSNPKECFDPDTLAPYLSQMQLFVFAVTDNLLSNSGGDIEKLIELAKKRHIPILPLVQEKIVSDKYENKFGNIQYLDRDLTTDTAITYRQQLEKYLTSLLVSDTLAKQIRESFDAYLFLSYRKKDVKYADKLMRTIHKYDFCRDIAIWYDEFLVPGEDFDDGIKETIRNSEAFVMMITPSVVDEENYVMRVEYPLAQKFRKNMIAVQMKKTDPKLLKKAFHAFPGCIDPYNEKELADALKKALSDIPLRKKNDSKHLFNIGAAYLWGIDVEVDKDKAEELITKASQKGNPDASKLLSMMYRNGAGVALDYGKAINLQEQHISLLKNSPYTRDNELSQSMLDLSELYGLIGNHKAQKDFLKKVIDLCDQPGNAEGNPYKMESLIRLGIIADKEGNEKAAGNYYNDANNIARHYSGPNQANIIRYRIRSNLLLAKLNEKSGQIDRAKQRYKEAMDEWRKYSENFEFGSMMDSISSHLNDLEFMKQKMTSFKDKKKDVDKDL